MNIRRDDGVYSIDEAAYLERWSFESQHPDDAFLKYRLPDGSFKHWMHTWTWANVEYNQKDGFPICAMEYAPPAPWLWDHEPDGDWLVAAGYVGLLSKLPGPWPDVAKYLIDDARNLTKPVYRVLLPALARAALHRHVDSMRSRVVNELDLIALSDRHYRLFPTKER